MPNPIHPEHPELEPDSESPEEMTLSPAALVQMSALFYSVVAVVAALWRVTWAGEPLFFVDAAAQERGVDWPRDLLLGLAAGVLVIVVSYLFTRFTAAGELLARRLASALGPLALWQTTFLALVSGFAEEAFFRGAVQPRTGLVVASILFGFAHFVPRREFYLWTVFSILAGFLLGGLFTHTGNLVAPIVAHTLVNAVNLPVLVRQYRNTEKRRSASLAPDESQRDEER